MTGETPDATSRVRTTRRRIAMGLGAAMFLLGLAILVRPLLGYDTVAGSRALDGGFAIFFMIRGVMNLRTAQRL